MTNGEILEKATKKAVKNGFTLYNTEILNKESWEDIAEKDYEIFIFNHNFSKAFWGEVVLFTDEEQAKKHPTIRYPYEIKNQGWEFHLQRMVIEKKPLKYLERFL